MDKTLNTEVMSRENNYIDDENSVSAQEESLVGWGKAALTLLYLITTMFLCSFSIALTLHHSDEQLDNSNPLSDVVLDNIPEWRGMLKARWIIYNLISAVTFLIGFLIAIFHSNSSVIFRRVFFIGGILYNLRSLLVISTLLPAPEIQWQCSRSFSELSFSPFIRFAGKRPINDP